MNEWPARQYIWSILTFELRRLDGKHVKGRQLKQSQLGYGNRRYPQNGSELAQHLNGALSERLHSARAEEVAGKEHTSQEEEEKNKKYRKIKKSFSKLRRRKQQQCEEDENLSQ